MMKLYKCALLSSILITTGAHATLNGLYDNSIRDFDYKGEKKQNVVTNRDVIKRVQIELSERGYNIGKIDGVYGPETRDEIARFQKSLGLYESGLINAETLKALNLEYVPPKKSRTYSE